MAFKSFLNFKYAHTHENRIWNKLCERLEQEFGHSDQEAYLIGNLLVSGKELDAFLVKEDSLTVIDFKDYGGELKISENATWTVSGTPINSGRKNPFTQLSDNKYAVLQTLKQKLPEGYENWVNIGHINALALFHQKIEYDLDNLSNDLSHSASKWFNICDFDHFIPCINEITSNQTSIRGQRTEILFSALGITLEKLQHFNGVDQQHKKEFKENPDTTSSSNEENFADFYYDTALKMDTIKLLIVGQDPYPFGANGVAFCKDNYYSLFMEEPEAAGATVLKSMGIDLERAREISRKNPKNLFYELLSKTGICFINVYHKVHDQIAIENRESEAEEASNFNMPIVLKSKKIILLGKGITKDTFEKFYKNAAYDHVFIHPSAKAKASNPSEWSEVWEQKTLEKLIIT
jgi:uracil DNA glycosylase